MTATRDRVQLLDGPAVIVARVRSESAAVRKAAERPEWRWAWIHGHGWVVVHPIDVSTGLPRETTAAEPACRSGRAQRRGD